MAKNTASFHNKNSEDSLLDRYVEEISVNQPLSAEEEAELSRRILKGDSRAMDKLVSANLRFVVSIARQYVTDGISMLDIIGEGNIGLIKAASKFDASKGKRFVQYAVWDIRRAIEAYLPQETVIMNRTATEHLAGNMKPVDTAIANNSEIEEMEQKIDMLPEREREVLSAYYGIATAKLTMAEIGQQMGLRRERVRQIRNRGLRRLHSLRNL